MLPLRLRTAYPHNVQLSVYYPCRATSRVSHIYRAFTTSHTRIDDHSGKVAIKWYEQTFPWSVKRRRVDPNNQEGEHDEEIREVQAEIDKLRAELHEMENPPEGKTFVEPLLAQFPEEEQKRLRAAIKQDELNRARKEEEKALVRRKLEERLPKKAELEIRWELPKDQSTYLRNLNETIYQSSSKLPSPLENRDVRKKLWQAYARCKAFLPPFLHLIPDRAWEVLFASQEIGLSNGDPHWAQLVILTEDKLKAGKQLNKFERMLYIWALRNEGRQEEAISQWQELKTYLGNDEEATDGYELLGVQLFASKGDPEKAEKISSSFLRKGPQKESRILIPIIEAWAQRGDDMGSKHAWILYLQLKERLGANITMDDYDNVILSFLNSGRADLGLAVFKDMMLTGQKSDQGSIELYSKSLGFMNRIDPSVITVEALNKIALTGLTTLPRRFQNKFFFGKWISKLLSIGATDAAASVIELMYERGVRPDSKHLNGIIGAWLRSGTDRNREKAAQMAWAMVYERIDLVKKRQKAGKVESTNVPDFRPPPVPVHFRRTVAPATIETMCLLLQHYTRRSQDTNVQLVLDSLLATEMEPNTYFINHLMYLDLRHGRHGVAFTRYKNMFRWQIPNLDTFICLWDCEKAHIDDLAVGNRRERFPSPRELMSEMMNWVSVLSMKANPSERKLVQQEFHKGIYDQIFRCMCHSSDLEGVIVVAYAMKETFGYYPDEANARMVSLQVARMSVGEEEARRRRKRGRSAGKNPQRQANTAKITQAFALIANQRHELLKEHGIDILKSNDEHLKEEEALFILAEFIRTVLRRLAVDDTLVESSIEKAAWEMGAGGIRMEDPLPSYDIKPQALDGVTAAEAEIA